MQKRISLLAAAVGAALAIVPASLAAGGNSTDATAGARCVKAGVAFLVQNHLVRAAALREIDYSDLDTDAGPAPGNDDTYSTSGAINADLPNAAYLSFWGGDPAAPHQPGAVRLVRVDEPHGTSGARPPSRPALGGRPGTGVPTGYAGSAWRLAPVDVPYVSGVLGSRP